jgi:signal transduction histidine kinase/CheY-like chemotaxis protein
MSVAIQFFLIVNDPELEVKLFQYVVAPLLITSLALFAFFSSRITNETAYHLLWLAMFGAIAFLVTGNEISLKENFSRLATVMEDGETQDYNLIALFYLVETAWYQSFVLFLASALLRPRLPYLLAFTSISFVAFLTLCFLLRGELLSIRIGSRISVFIVCCIWNIYSCWVLEESERKGYFLSKDLEGKLASEKEKLRVEAEAKSKAERVLVSYLCHEIRNPFAGVLGFAELIVSALAKIVPRSTVLNKAKTISKRSDQDSVQDTLVRVADWCSIIVVNSEHIRDVLDNVLDLSKLESGTLELAHVPIKVADLCTKIDLLLRSTARTGVDFAVEVVPHGLVINGDHQRWKQLLVNLVSNALKFTHYGRVVLRIEQVPGDGVSVEVRDTGVGISAKEQASLFQRYQQLHSSTALDTKGTGLGLVIAQRIATLFESGLEIESPWRKRRTSAGGSGEWGDGSDQGGAGTRFFFNIKKCVAAEDGSNDSGGESDGVLSVEERSDGGNGGVDNGELRGGLKVLVVDDDMLNRMIMSTKLTQSDEFKHTAIAIIQATSDADVEALMDEHGVNYFDVIIMDEHLGEESAQGSAITKQLREQGCTSAIIACSGNCLKDDELAYKAAGASACWPKPFPSTSKMRDDLLQCRQLRG